MISFVAHGTAGMIIHIRSYIYIYTVYILKWNGYNMNSSLFFPSRQEEILAVGFLIIKLVGVNIYN
jgi:hypothetical protein